MAHGSFKVARLSLRRPEEAEQLLHKAAALAPDRSAPWTNLGCMLASQGRTIEADVALRKAVLLEPFGRLPLANLALLLLNNAGSGPLSDKLDEACNLLRRLTAAHPGIPGAHHCLAAALHRKSVALGHQTRVVDTGPTIPSLPAPMPPRCVL